MNLLDQISVLIDEERLAHGYVIQGDPLSDGKSFAVEILCRLFEKTSGRKAASERHRIETRIHPDVFWVEPASKLRKIVKRDMDAAMKRISEKSFEGGWKVVVFLGAERMNPETGNQLLKTLEEPPPKTLLLLVSDVPEQLMVTIRSRCQLLIAPRNPSVPPVWAEALLEILREGPPRSLLDRLTRAAQFRSFMEEAAKAHIDAEDEGADDESAAGEEDVEEAVRNARETAVRRLIQRQVMEAVEAWYRDMLVVKLTGGAEGLRYPMAKEDLKRQAEPLQTGDIFKLLENTRLLAGRLESNTPLQVVMESAVI
jgi:DNA polymerase-3 subunit delta'